MESFLANPIIGFLWPIATLIGVAWLTYFDVIKGDWVSDDILGMAIYDGQLQKPIRWHNIFKKLRYELGKIPNPNRDWKVQKQPSHISSNQKHHKISISIHSANLISLYLLLWQIVGWKTAFLATLLFAVHPTGCQTIAWISGIGYPTASFFMSAGMNLAILMNSWGWMESPIGVVGSLVIYGLFQWMAIEAQFCTIGATLVLAYLGLWPFAIVAGAISFWGCFNTFMDAVVLRRKTFKDQKMDQSTYFYFRKVVTVFKTLYYYVRLSLFPKRMGLYHQFCYHYDLPYVEYEDNYFWKGIVIAAGLVASFIFGSDPIRIGIVWFLSFVLIFLNWITAHQFVGERYVWLPALGTSLILASVLPPVIFWIVFGIALMRTWAHLPTYYNEVDFYRSNLVNFPQSEVALGNLGVAYQQRGLVGSALETWAQGVKQYPDYDVNWYNISSSLRSRGQFNPNWFPILTAPGGIMPQEVVQDAYRSPGMEHIKMAIWCLDKAINSKTCHFPEVWKKEHADMIRLTKSVRLLPLEVINEVPFPDMIPEWPKNESLS